MAAAVHLQQYASHHLFLSFFYDDCVLYRRYVVRRTHKKPEISYVVSISWDQGGLFSVGSCVVAAGTRKAREKKIPVPYVRTAVYDIVRTVPPQEGGEDERRSSLLLLVLVLYWMMVRRPPLVLVVVGRSSLAC